MPKVFVCLCFGGADGVRTHDLLDAIEARSQLRHGPTGVTPKVYHTLSGRDAIPEWMSSAKFARVTIRSARFDDDVRETLLAEHGVERRHVLRNHLLHFSQGFIALLLQLLLHGGLLRRGRKIRGAAHLVR